MEKFLLDFRVVSQFASSNNRATSEEAHAAFVQQQQQLQHLNLYEDLLLASIVDQTLFSQKFNSPEHMDEVVLAKVKEHSLFEDAPVHVHHRLAHVVDYPATYYSYVWCRVRLSEPLFYVLEQLR
eukprot:m.151491 g.151491  ORF g.151491 m.151491 type:complete len:125 (+) comp14250_c1_seq4:2105-2479(+)